MKKMILVLIVLILSIGFFGCDNGSGGGGKELPGTITLYMVDDDENVIYDNFFTGDTIYHDYYEIDNISSEWKLDGEVIGTERYFCDVENPGILTVTISAAGYNSKTSDPVTISISITPAEYFTFDAATGTITDYRNDGPKDINIPASIGGTPVTTIGDDAFKSNALTSVIIPDSVTSIGDAAFWGNRLTSVTIPDSVITIGSQAFDGNSPPYGNELTSITIGNSVTTIGYRAFAENYLTNVTIPDSVITIGNYAFLENNLTSVTIGDNVTSIGNYAFELNNLTSVTIPDSVTTIGYRAFSYSYELISITIGEDITLSSSFENDFDNAYDENGKQAGTYTYQDGTREWTFTPRE